MSKTLADKNKALVLAAFDTLFNQRVTTPRRAIGRRTMSSTAPILRPAARGYSS
jgi:hypothetical protein